MFTIEGKYVSAACFAGEISEDTRGDIRRLCDREELRDRKICIMPDVHPNGDGSVTGFTMTLREPVILALEYGSGCGILAAQLENEGSITKLVGFRVPDIVPSAHVK